MDVKYINPFIIATQTTFKTMFSTELKLNKPILKQDRRTSGDITGIMGLVGDKKGTLCVSFNERGALYLYSLLVGEKYEKVTSEIVDSIGELTNIISGQSRKEFEKIGLNLSAAIPIVIVGKNVELNFITVTPIVSVPFAFSLSNGDIDFINLDFSFENAGGK